MHFQNGKAELQTKLSIVKDETRDEYLEERLKQYDRWMAEGKIPTSSKVIPVRESLTALQWVLPTEQVMEIMRNSRSYALANCACRERYKRCDHPLEVCFYINDVADKAVALGKARHVTLKEAEEKLKLANQYGLIHLSIYNPDQYVYAVCSCCECCCHDLQFLKKFNRSDLIVFSEYIAVVDEEACSHCSACVKRCVFGAKKEHGQSVTFDRSRCYGCGLCLTVCPVQAIQMERRNKKRRKNTSDARV